MTTTNFNSRAASLALAAAIAAINPVIKGYFCLSMEVGHNVLASVSGVNTPDVEILTSRVWTHTEDGDDIDVAGSHIDTTLIEAVLHTA